MRLAVLYDARVHLPAFHALKAWHLAVMASSTSLFHHQVSRCHQLGFVVPHTSSVVFSKPVMSFAQISSVVVAASVSTAGTCALKTSWNRLNVWGSLSFHTFGRGVNLCLIWGGISIIMSHTRSWCCRATSSPGITFTSITSLRRLFRNNMKSIWVAVLPDLYVMWWLSRFLKHV